MPDTDVKKSEKHILAEGFKLDSPEADKIAAKETAANKDRLKKNGSN